MIVNRVWLHLFGRGLVETPDDFGTEGALPSHPELLDDLAARFVRGGWNVKALIRELVLSRTYQLSSDTASRPAELAADAGNVLLWRHTPARLEAEVIRDSILKVSGQFNAQMGGPGFRDFKMYNHKGSWVYDPIDPEGEAFNRRSIYRTWARGNVHPLLAPLDCPDPSAAAPVRSVTTTPLSALALMNTSFALRMSDRFAERLKADAGDDLKAQAERSFQLAFAREPSAQELAISTEFIKDTSLATFCRVLFNSNEFIYVN